MNAVKVEVIRVPSKKERRLAQIAESARQANVIAQVHNAMTANNRKKYAGRNNKPKSPR